MDIATSMYYTFSTIAQVLAAFLALSSVFTIYKIQNIIKSQHFYKNDYVQQNNILIKKEILNLIEFYTQSENFDSVVNILKDISKDKLVDKTESDKARLAALLISKGEVNKNRLIFLTTYSLIIGVITIIFSLIVIPLIPFINNYFFYIVVAEIGSIFSIVIMSINIYKSIFNK